MDDLSPYIAGTQIAITMIGIAVGSFVEPYITKLLSGAFGNLDPRISYGVAFLFVVFVLVVVGELCPKYVSLQFADRLALLYIRPLSAVVTVLKPIIWLAQKTSTAVLRPFNLKVDSSDRDVMQKDELIMLVQSGGAEGVLDKTHAEVVSRALRLDVLDARDIMVHRLDMKWLDVSLTKPELLERLKEIPFSRIPVGRGDIDDLVGVIYIHDVVRRLNDPDFSVESLARPLVVVPENLSLEKIVSTMREEKTQILIVMDEYGGTSGLVTLEDVVEEVFGELEDRLESERPPIETFPAGRISARADVRFDELVTRLNLPIEVGDNTDTLATIMVEALARVPRPGDSVQTDLGLMRVENMARRRITRVSIQLPLEWIAEPAS